MSYQNISLISTYIFQILSDMTSFHDNNIEFKNKKNDKNLNRVFRLDKMIF